MRRHRAIATLAFGILGLTLMPIIGSIIAVVLGRARLIANSETVDHQAEKFRRVGLALGYVGVGLASTAIVVGLVIGLARTL